eukprot:7744963-Heterocapsa_arctica.AAC.1
MKVYAAPECLGDRVGALRVRCNGLHDFFLCVIYAPSEPHSRVHREGMLAIMEWVNIQLRALPMRTTPILFMDANAKVGYTSQLIGPYRPDVPSWNGRQLTHLCEQHDLVLLNTWWAPACGPTWSSGRGHFSRIDYIAIPQTFTTTIYNVALWRTTATLLQQDPGATWRALITNHGTYYA